MLLYNSKEFKKGKQTIAKTKQQPVYILITDFGIKQK